MRKGIALVVVALMALLASTEARAWGNCNSVVTPNADFDVLTKGKVICFDTAVATSATTGVLQTTGCLLTVRFDPDASGAGTGALAQLYACSAANTTSCDILGVDTDFDGVPDTATMDGVTIGRQGQQYQTADFVYATITAPGAGDYARLMISCH